MNTVRIQIDVPEERYAEIERIMSDAGFTTKRELFDNMFTLFRWVMKQASQGRLLGALDEETDRFTEVQMPFLQNLQTQNARRRAVA